MARGRNGSIIGVDNLPTPVAASGVWSLAEVVNHIAASRWPGTCGCTPAYPTLGDRTAQITVTTSASLISSGIASNFVDGATGTNSTDSVALASMTVSSSVWIKFDYGSGNMWKVTEARFTHEAGNHGTWQWQHSDDDSSWTNIGSSVTLGSAGTSETYDLSAVTAGHRYYRILGVSGSTNLGIWNQEFEFQDCDCAA